MMRRVGLHNPWSCSWAIHPGGKGILTAFEKAFGALGIKGEGLQHSFDVLGEFGNMSSATILFVLQRVLAGARRDRDVFMCGFGPGLTVEFGRLRFLAPGAGAALALSTEAARDAADGVQRWQEHERRQAQAQMPPV
jgi:hypothetical protein